MKKIALILITVFSYSCQKKLVSERASWKLGDEPKNLSLINSREWSTKNSEIEFKNEKIEITRQSVLGIPIENSYLKKVFKTIDGKLVLISAEALITTPPPMKMAAGLSFNENEIIKNIKNLKETFSKISNINSETVFAEKNKQLIPSLKVSFFDRWGEPWSVYADQKSSIFSLVREGSHFEDKTTVETTIFPSGPKHSSLTEVILNNLNFEPTLSNADIVVTTEADKKILNLSQSLVFDTKDVRFDQVQAFYYLNRSLAWMKEKFDVNFSQQLEVVVHVGFPEKTNTAFYFKNKIRLGAGDDQVYSQIPQDPSIISHESFHYLIDQMVGLPYEAEGGSLNEAFADFFTCTMLDRPELADSSYLKAPFKRSLELSNNLSEKNGGLYHDSLIVSSLLWELSQKLGSEKALPLAFDVLKNLHRYSDFQDFKSKLVNQINKNLKKEDVETANLILAKRGFND
jgi:Zn-dependent metalloprotease